MTYLQVCSHISIPTEVCTSSNSRAYEEKFSESDVEASFLYLLSKLEALWSDADCFNELKKMCERDNLLTDKLKSDVNNVNSLEEFVTLLARSPFCTWLELRILKRMAKVAEVPEATHMIDVFEKCVHSRKCSEVEAYFREKYINPDHLTLVEAKLNQNANDLMVCDLIEYCHKLESILKIPPKSTAVVAYKEGCLKICFAIPTYCCLHAYEIAKINYFRLRPIHIQYLQIGTFQKIYAIGSTCTNSDASFLSWISCIDNCKFSMYIYMYLFCNVCTYFLYIVCTGYVPSYCMY